MKTGKLFLQKKHVFFINNEIIINKHAHSAVLRKPPLAIEEYEMGNGCLTDPNTANTLQLIIIWVLNKYVVFVFNSIEEICDEKFIQYIQNVRYCPTVFLKVSDRSEICSNITAHFAGHTMKPFCEVVSVNM